MPALLQAAGLPLDAVLATRASLIEECGADYFGADSQRKRRFHRTLVDMGLVVAETAPIRRDIAGSRDRASGAARFE